MTQDQHTGAEANVFGKRMAEIVAAKIGAVRVDSDGNEFLWNGKRITIRSAHKGNTYVGVLFGMLDRVDAVLAAIEFKVKDEFQVWAIDKQTYEMHSKPQIKNPNIAQVSTKVFREHADLIDKVRDRK
jgi:hypothetical protein